MSESVIHVFETLSNLGHTFRVLSEYVQSLFRVCSECVKSVFRVFSECVQSLFRVCSECVQSMFRVCFISSPSASFVSVLGIFTLESKLICQTSAGGNWSFIREF